MLMASEAIGNSAAVFLKRLIHMLMASGADRKFRCGFLRRLIHMLIASETTDNSAAVF